MKKINNNSGIILIVILWILVILSMLAVGIGRRTDIELTLTKYYIGKLKAKYIAMSGFIYGMGKSLEDKRDRESSRFDTKSQCGYKLEEDETAEDLFKENKIKNGLFSIYYVEEDNNKNRAIRYGFQDEESKININTITPATYMILLNLITQFGYEKEIAETIASSVIDWKDEDSNVFNDPYGAEDDFYISNKENFHCKNYRFESIDELLLVRGMTQEIFNKIKNYVTVFPDSGKFLINFDTASSQVLKAFAQSFIGAKTNTVIDDAENLVEKIILYRQGNDEIDGTDDDNIVELNDINVNAKERILFLKMLVYRTKISNFFRIRVKGIEDKTKASSDVEAVINRDKRQVVYWRRK